MTNRTTPLLVTVALLAMLMFCRSTQADAQTATETCVEPAHRFVGGGAVDVVLPTELPAGRYWVSIHTGDSYPDRHNSDPALQTSERVEVLGIVTDDLIDGVTSSSATEVQAVTLTDPISRFRATHANNGTHPDSVVLDAVCFTPIPDEPTTTTTEPPATTTEQATTTTTPLTEHTTIPPVPHQTVPPTTAPPTTEAPTTTAPPSTSTSTPVLPPAPAANPTPAQPKYTG